MMISKNIKQAVTTIRKKGVIAYPTEAMFGLGCNPFCETAVNSILAMKERSIDMGLILVASYIQDILPLIDLTFEEIGHDIISSWPGHTTWIFPAATSTPSWICGKKPTVAIRISAHPIVQSLCQELGGPLVSTSANIHGHPPCLCAKEVKEFFPTIDFILDGDLGKQNQPSQIFDAITKKQLR